VQADGLIAGAYDTLMTFLKSSLLSSIVDAGIGATWRPIIFHGPGDADYDYLLTGLNGTTLRTMRGRTVGKGV